LNEKLLKENLDEGVTSDNSRPSSLNRGPATSITSCRPWRSKLLETTLLKDLRLDYDIITRQIYAHNQEKYKPLLKITIQSKDVRREL